jgi:hypothetical protein
MSNYPAGSMMGSGIYSVEVSYDKFTCENEECGKENEAGDSATDDWGNYEVVCQFCEVEHFKSSLSQDKDDYYADYSEDR